MEPSNNPAGLYEVVWMDDSETPRRRRFYCQSDQEKKVYEAGKRMAEHSRHGSQYLITVRESTPDW